MELSLADSYVLNWGIVSTGSISNRFCYSINQCLNPRRHVVKGVAARNLDDAKAFAIKHNLNKYFGSYEELFQQEDINVIYIGTINSNHKEITIKALNYGKHVICEKPMTLNSREQEEVFKAAKENNVFFMEALMTRFFPIIERLRSDILSGSFGEVKFFSSFLLANIKDMDRLSKKELGGGAVLDVGIYPIGLACLVFNHEKPIKITVTGHLMQSTGVDECCTIVLLYSRQRIAQINISISCARLDPTFIITDKGIFKIPELSHRPKELLLPSGEKIYEPYPKCDDEKFHSSGLSYEAEAVRLAIANGLKEHPSLTWDNSRLIMHIMDEAKKQLGYIID